MADWLTRYVVGLSERIRKRCEQEGRSTFTMKMLREEKRKMYEGEGAASGNENNKT